MTMITMFVEHVKKKSNFDAWGCSVSPGNLNQLSLMGTLNGQTLCHRIGSPAFAQPNVTTASNARNRHSKTVCRRVQFADPAKNKPHNTDHVAQPPLQCHFIRKRLFFHNMSLGSGMFFFSCGTLKPARFIESSAHRWHHVIFSRITVCGTRSW